MKKLSFTLITFLIILVISPFVLQITLLTYSKIYQNLISPEDEITLFAIGGSTSYGDPYDERPNFAQIVKESFAGSLDGKKINVKVIAKPAWNINQNIYSLMKELYFNPPKHGVFLVYTGVNECFNSKSKSELLKFWDFVYGNFVFYAITSQFMKSGFDILHQNDQSLFTLRLNRISELAESFGYKMLISSISGNFHDYDPPIYSDYGKSNNRDPRIKRINELSDSKNRNLEIVLEEYSKATNSQFKKYYAYLLGLEYRKINNDEKAKEYFLEATDFDCSYVPSPSTNKTISEFAKNKNIPFVDSFVEIQKSSSSGYIDSEMYWDAHHPRLPVMLITGNLMVSKLEEIFGVKRAESQSVDSLVKKFEITKERIDYMRYTRSIWYTFNAVNSVASYFKAKKALEFLENNNSNRPQGILFLKGINHLSLFMCEKSLEFLNEIDLKIMKNEFINFNLREVQAHAHNLKLKIHYCDSPKEVKEKIIKRLSQIFQIAS